MLLTLTFTPLRIVLSARVLEMVFTHRNVLKLDTGGERWVLKLRLKQGVILIPGWV